MSKPFARPQLTVVNGHATTTSLQVANNFGKEHYRVLRAIENLECTPEFRHANFGETVHERENPSGGAPIKSKAYTITRDGFVFLAMGFTGKEAAQWKEAYINAFNAMESELNKTAPGTFTVTHEELAELVDSRINKAIGGAKYNYPRELLEQAHYITPERDAALSIAMLADKHYKSPTQDLICELIRNGHDVGACAAEVQAMREHIRNFDALFSSLMMGALKAGNMASSYKFVGWKHPKNKLLR